MLPFSAIGFIGWAKKWAETPLRLIMDSVIRVTFPAYSRLQENKELLAKTIEKSLFFLALFIFPTTVLLILLIKPLVFLIPRYSKWEPALFSFYLFAISAVLAAFSSPLVNALNALGKIKTTLSLMIVWTTLTWILVPILILSFGFNGVAIASLLIGLTSFLPMMLLRRIVYFEIFAPLFKPLGATIIMSAAVVIFTPYMHDFPSVLMIAALGGVIYGILTWIFLKKEILPYLQRLIK
jgi:PST family polysaccharide transporter